jgi:tryptophan synthase alpha chain
MNKLDILFNKKQENLLSIFFTAGYPEKNSTIEIINSLEEADVDFIEIGIPFSDPIADGPVIQFSNNAAIENGVSLKSIFEDLKILNGNSRIPKLLMGYFNPVLQYGVEQFCKDCNVSGVDGVIIPDLPADEFEANYKNTFEKYGIHFIFLVSPQTSVERLKKIEELSTSFIYAVSSNSTTGGTSDFNSQKFYFKRLNENLSKPFLIGFGVNDKESNQIACNYANGSIVGSSFIKVLSKSGEMSGNIKEFIQSIKI